MKYRWSKLIPAICFVRPFGFPAGWSQADDKPAVIRVGLNSGADTFDPALSPRLSERYIVYAVYDTLVQYDKDSNIKPAPAESWSNPDPLTYVSKLRQGVVFKDRTPRDDNVVAWNINRINLSPSFEFFEICRTSIRAARRLGKGCKSETPVLREAGEEHLV